MVNLLNEKSEVNSIRAFVSIEGMEKFIADYRNYKVSLDSIIEGMALLGTAAGIIEYVLETLKDNPRPEVKTFPDVDTMMESPEVREWLA